MPCADVLRAGGTAALRREMQAAQTEAWVTPGGHTGTDVDLLFILKKDNQDFIFNLKPPDISYIFGMFMLLRHLLFI